MSAAALSPSDVLMSTKQQHAAQANKVRPGIQPNSFSGEATERWDHWVGHFESVAQVIGWNKSTCLLWLEVRLTGKAHNAWRRLTVEWYCKGCTQNGLSRMVDVNCTWLNSKLELVEVGRVGKNWPMTLGY